MIMSKVVQHGDRVRKALIGGMQKLAGAIRSTLGPKGRNVMIAKDDRNFLLTKDGATVAKEFVTADKFENLSAALLKEVSKQTAKIAGDGTTTAAILTETIFSEGAKLISAGVNPMELKRGIDRAIEKVETALSAMAEPLDSFEKVTQIATIASSGDREVGKLIAEAFQKVTSDGCVTVEEGTSRETTLEIVEGTRFQKGFLSPYFLTDSGKMACEFEELNLLIADEKITSVHQLLPFLENYSENGGGRPLLIMAESFEEEVLTTLVLNKVKGGMPICAVETPERGEFKKEILEDFAVLTGAIVLSGENGRSIETADMSFLGRVRKGVVGQETTTLIGGYGDEDALQKRIAQLNHQISTTTHAYEKEKLEKRRASLSGGIGVIRVGASTETELKEKKGRIEDALNTTQSALEEGTVIGGGTAFIRAGIVLENPGETEEEKMGTKVVLKALRAPLIALADNCGKSGEVIAEKVSEMEGNQGYNGETDLFCDLRKEGIIDSAKVVKTALRTAASIAGIALTTTSMIVEKKNNELGD